MLQSQGFGSRKECTKLVCAGRFAVAGEVIDNPKAMVNAEGLVFEVDGTAWEYRKNLYILYHKPIGWECSRSPEHHESIFDQFPFPFMARDLQPAGRLDVDTDGALILSDDGAFLHHLISPKQMIPKTYRLETRHPISDADLKRLETGLELRNEKGVFAATSVERLGERQLRMTVERGVYHQVRRMIAVLSNRLETLTRESIGGIGLGTLSPGEWRNLTDEEVALLGR